MKKEKEQLTISADLESSEKAKELLDDLEVLKDKYDMSILVSIYPQPNLGEWHEQTQ